MSATTEREQFETAERAALEAIDEGDRPLVAAHWAAEKHDIEHRFWDLYQRVKEEIDDAE